MVPTRYEYRTIQLLQICFIFHFIFLLTFLFFILSLFVPYLFLSTNSAGRLLFPRETSLNFPIFFCLMHFLPAIQNHQIGKITEESLPFCSLIFSSSTLVSYKTIQLTRSIRQ
uniref:Uncharacterized protein n=1 Tax=Cacopsylla melanoneura TaxID=428564 RepID=A0A8D8R491_9HEMI